MLRATEEPSKEAMRKKVWDYMEKNDLACFPRPVHGRIPNFRGSQEAAQKLSQTVFFKEASTLKVNPDKPQEPVRFLALEAKKNLLVPLPRISSGLLRRVVPPLYATKQDLRVAASQQGLKQYGKPVALDSKVKVDLVVLGSVAVSEEGFRIGKGEGFADLEFAMMKMMSVVSQDTIVASTVHDCQVFDSLPKQLFEAHDVPVDFIITPTRIIEVKPRLPKPEGLIWNLLSETKYNEIPILKTIREAELRKGKDCTLKSTISSTDRLSEKHSYGNERADVVQLKNRKYGVRNEKSSVEDSSSSQKQPFHENEIDSREEFRASREADVVIRLSNIGSNVRVRDLKNSLRNRGVNAGNIVWNGYKGQADLHIFKLRRDSEASKLSSGEEVNNILSSLRGLKLDTADGGALRIELVS